MKKNSIEHQIAQLLKDGHSEDQIASMIDLPCEQVKAIYRNYIAEYQREKSKASNQHNQAIYAMSLHG